MAEDDLGVDVVDVSGMDGVFVRTEVVLTHDPFWAENKRYSLPEEDMEKLEELIGDGNATVTVGMDMKYSENFSTAGCSVYVKLTCGQTEEQIEKARDIAHKLSLQYAEEGYTHARYILDSALGREVQIPSGMSKVLKGVAKDTREKDRTPKRVLKKKEDPENRGQKKPRLLKNRPDFRR